MATTPARRTRTRPIGRHSNGRLMTTDEFDAITRYDDRYSYELVHGVLIVSPIPRPGERNPNDELYHLLRLYQTYHPQGGALDDSLPEEYIHLPTSRRRADRVVWCGLGRVPDPEKDVPTIAVEFVSARTRDRELDYGEKRVEYLATGVQEYWVIDRFTRTMTVFRPGPDGPVDQVIEAGGTFETPLLPGFQLPIDHLFARADRWKKRPKRK